MIAGSPTALGAQGQGVVAESVTVVAGERYLRGGMHRWLFGSGYRTLWATPLRVPVVDLETFAGGVTVDRRGGFGQTRSLRLINARGEQFVARSVEKNPAQGLPPELVETFVSAVVQDQISALHPAAALVVQPLAEAAGILHASPRLVVLPDSPILGEYREEFAGMLAVLEERPDEAPDGTEGFADSRQVVSTENLFKRLEANPREQVDAEDFLTARLLDLFIGDRDRHADQWRWAGFETSTGGGRWRAIPRDRDQAFIQYSGAVATVTRYFAPHFVSFGASYPPVVWATWNGRGLDRRLLAGLSAATWDSVAHALQGRLTDSVIAAAVRRMPPEYFALDGARLEALLRIRRGLLPAVARAFYLVLAETTDLHATDVDELVEIERAGDGTVTVAIARDGGRNGSAGPYLQREFRPEETREIRLFMHGGDDRVRIRGEGEGPIRIRVIGGGGRDVLADSAQGGGTFFHDSRGRNEFHVGPETQVDRVEAGRIPMDEQFPSPEPERAFDAHARTWGSWTRPTVWGGVEPGLGLVFGGGLIRYGYGFRRSPFQSVLTVRAGQALGAGRGLVEARLVLPALTPRWSLETRALVSGLETVTFSGFGNETPRQDGDLSRIRQTLYVLEALVTYRPTARLGLSAGAIVQESRTSADSGMGVEPLELRGIGNFGLAGLRTRVSWDSRDALRNSRKGILVQVGADLYPSIFTPERAITRLHGEGRAFLSPAGPGGPTLAARVGGTRVWGDAPFFERPTLGGTASLRGFRLDRFRGDGAVYGGAEIRQALGEHGILLPGQFGIFGGVDVGRVWQSGEVSRDWHVGGVGGVWFTMLNPGTLASVGLGRSRESTTVHVGAGFAW